MTLRRLRAVCAGTVCAALVSSVLVFGQDPAPAVPLPGVHPLRPLTARTLTATGPTPGLDVLAWRRQFASLRLVEFRDVIPGGDLLLRGSPDAIEALIALFPQTASGVVLTIAADEGLTLGPAGDALGRVDGQAIRLIASFYQGHPDSLVKIPGGLIVSGPRAMLWVDAARGREPLIVRLAISVGDGAVAVTSSLAAFDATRLAAGVQVDADADSAASPGDTLRYRLTVGNAGDTLMTGVLATLPLDPRLTAVAGSLDVSPIALDRIEAPIEDTALSITLSGSDADGHSLTYAIATQPAHGLLAQTTAGGASVTYTPFADYNGPDTFTFRVNDGRADSNETATVRLTVGPVNDAPSFTAGNNQSVSEDSAAQTVTGWATAISAGPSDESGQTISFEITGNTNATLFSTAPALSAEGTLTYTPAVSQSGTAMISVRARDSGGTANGGTDVSAVQTFTIAHVLAEHDRRGYRARRPEPDRHL